MESYIRLSNLNDFIFCPKSIYYHTIYDSYDKSLYQEEAQIAGSIAHEAIDKKKYSTRKDILQSLDVYSEAYGIAWKIDTFYIKEWKLVERKNKIEKIYLWYKYQLWWQMFCLEEMGYKVKKMEFYSVQDNKKYRLYRPSTEELEKFQATIERYKRFSPLRENWKQNTMKCRKCIYRELCDYFIGEIYPQMPLFDEDSISS